MGRYTFSFMLGIVAGAAGVITYQSLKKRCCGEETSENLIDSLGHKLRSLETRFIDAKRESEGVEVAS